jgi:hypothetical protein
MWEARRQERSRDRPDVAEMQRLASERCRAAFGLHDLAHPQAHQPRRHAGTGYVRQRRRAVRDRARCNGGGHIFEVAIAGIVPFDDAAVANELDWIGEMALQTGLTATFIVLHTPDSNRWRNRWAQAGREAGRRADVVRSSGRPFGVLLHGWDVRHPFRLRPSYEETRPSAPPAARCCGAPTCASES